MSKAKAAEKVRQAYIMNEQGWPMTAEQIRLRPVLIADARRVRETGTYKKVA